MAARQDELVRIKAAIENMSKFHQVGVLKLLSTKDGLTINENNNGVFVNLTDVDGGVLEDLNSYIGYVEEQECDLSQQEAKKAEYKNVFFSSGGSADGVASHSRVKTVRKGNRDTPSSTGDDVQTESA